MSVDRCSYKDKLIIGESDIYTFENILRFMPFCFVNAWKIVFMLLKLFLESCHSFEGGTKLSIVLVCYFKENKYLKG